MYSNASIHNRIDSRERLYASLVRQGFWKNFEDDSRMFEGIYEGMLINNKPEGHGILRKGERILYEG